MIMLVRASSNAQNFARKKTPGLKIKVVSDITLDARYGPRSCLDRTVIGYELTRRAK
jgi:hypothetical protein